MGQVKQTPNSIGYVELTFAKANNLPTALIKNSAGTFVEPSGDSVSKAAAGMIAKMPADLRFVISVAKITPILERIADHAGNIAKAAIILNDEPEIKPLADLPLMAQTAEEMLRNALDAFTSEDSETSREIIKQDKKIDESYKKVFGELLRIMIENPTTTTSAAHLLFVAKHLERIGDYIKDICELNAYLREAAFIKHSHLK
jgi:phosphate transport system protein